MVRKQMRDVEVVLTLFAAAVSPFSTTNEDGRQGVRVPRRSEQLYALQDGRLAAVVGPDEQVDAAEAIKRERVEPAITGNEH